jgi:CHAD domain-containing protein
MSGDVLRSKLLRARVNRFVRQLDGIENGDTRALHRTRVASRRLREALPILQVDPAIARKLGRRLRRITAQLGTVRELDVLLLLIDELSAARPNLARALQRVRADAAARRDEARKHLFDELPMEEIRRVGRKLERLADDLRREEESSTRSVTRKAGRWAIDARLVHRSGRLQTSLQAAGALYAPDRLHDVRIAVKKLRYAVELSAETGGTRRTAMLQKLRRTQDLLGRMHDLQTLIDTVRGMQASVAPLNAALWRELDALVLILEDDCRRLHGRYVGEGPALAAIAAKLAARSPGGRPIAARPAAAGLRRRAG